MITNEFILRFLETENQKLSETARNSETKIRFWQTKDLASASTTAQQRQKRFRPFYWYRWLIGVCLCIDIVAIVMIIDQMSQSKLSIFSAVGLLALLFILLLIPVTIFVRQRKTNEIIEISTEGVFTNTMALPWTQLTETFIMKVPIGKYSKIYLVLVTAENLILKFETKYLSVSETKLATLIEDCKKLQRDSPTR